MGGDISLQSPDEDHRSQLYLITRITLRIPVLPFFALTPDSSENKLSPGTAEWALTEAIADLPSVPISDKYLVVSLATVNYYPFNNKEKRLLIRCRVKAFKL